jgi:hypothetical protein
MSTRRAVSLLVVALVAVTASARAGEKAAPVNAQRFEALKKLAGDWVQVGEDGKPTDKVVSSIRVTSGGTAVLETIFPGTDHEMVSLYHMDGSDLLLTHYCCLGNQPRLRAEPSGEANKIVFTFAGGTNLKSNNDRHINGATFTLDGKDHFKAQWVCCQDGKPCHQEDLDLVRKQK